MAWMHTIKCRDSESLLNQARGCNRLRSWAGLWRHPLLCLVLDRHKSIQPAGHFLESIGTPLRHIDAFFRKMLLCFYVFLIEGASVLTNGIQQGSRHPCSPETNCINPLARSFLPSIISVAWFIDVLAHRTAFRLA